MTVLSGGMIRKLEIVSPTVDRSQHEETGTSYGLSMCGYDVRLDQEVWLRPGHTVLASTLEHFSMPQSVVGIVHDKSTWARRGISVQNTVIEPGWRGYLTLELLWSPVLRDGLLSLQDLGVAENMRLPAGTPIAQILFHRLTETVEGYSGKYQDQERGPQEAR